MNKQKVLKETDHLKICFTGHRANGLPWKYDEEKRVVRISKKLCTVLLKMLFWTITLILFMEWH